MSINRRKFIRTTGGLVLGTATRAIPSLAIFQQGDLLRRKLRVAVFHEPTFPTLDFTPVEQATIQTALKGCDVSFLGLKELVATLDTRHYDVFVNPYGSAFPKAGFMAISTFLQDGGNWVNIGGIPFSVPVVKADTGWRQEIRQTSHHKKLGITQAFPVSARNIGSYAAGDAVDDCRDLPDELTVEEVYELYVRFTVTKDFPSEDGSAGARDAVLRPVLFGLDDKKRRVAAPVVQVDRLQGEFAGGRWMLANFKGTIAAKAIRSLVETASHGAMELNVRPSFACYHEGETPSLSVQFRYPKGEVESVIDGDCRIELRDEHKKTLETMDVRLLGEGTSVAADVDFSARRTGVLPPGLYAVSATMNLKWPSVGATGSIKNTTGFWVFDKKLLSGGKPLSVDKDYFWRDGEPFPVTGTTYMTSDVHRKFLFEPNPFVWAEGFSQMKNSGVNMVRTGMWTAWKNYMLDVGAPNEATLRALDAFVLTARKFDIPLIFTFFAFLPESWGGINAYLDPRSLNAQKEFITAITRRYRAVNDIVWDIINEPSFCSSQHLWSCRPNYDKYESAAWNLWLKERMQDTSEGERLAQLQERFRADAGEPIDLPTPEDFEDANIFNEHRPIKVIDYRLFAQEMFTKWVEEIKTAIRSNGNSHQLITVGQDEGGTGDRPNPQFFGDTVDFTCIHNWWFNDDLVWDNVVTKTPERANLVEETGVMFYEKMDGSAWRTEEEARNLLERKLAISMGTGGAGFLEWIWNTNPYMQSDNEAAIGLFRADGTAKPEFDSVAKFAGFFASNKHLMVGRKAEDVLLVIPHSQLFSPRNFASEATKRCVRVMNYHLNIPMASASEYRLDAIQSFPPLLVLPSPRTLNQRAWEKLLAVVEQGSTLLVTGIVDTDDHWLPADRMKQFGVASGHKPVAEEEFLSIGGTEYQVSYRGDKIQRIEKAVLEKNVSGNVLVLSHGRGKIIWSPLPVEISDSVEPCVALYEYALKEAGLSPVFTVEKKDPSVLILPNVFKESILYTCVSECDRDSEVRLTDKETKTAVTVAVPAQRVALVFLNRKTGEILAKLT